MTGVLPTGAAAPGAAAGRPRQQRAAHRPRCSWRCARHRPSRRPAGGPRARLLPHRPSPPAAPSRRCAGSGISCPDLESYAPTLWNYWEDHLDRHTARDRDLVAALDGPHRGDHRRLLGHRQGRPRSRSPRPAASRSWWRAARTSSRRPSAEIEARGGTAHVYGCDLSDLEAIDALCEQIRAEHERIDFVVNNAGRSIRRSLALSHDRFHDFERTMQLNYFGAVRLVMGLLPRMREQGRGHIVNISSIGVQTNPPRFSAYVASKAALDSWSNVVSLRAGRRRGHASPRSTCRWSRRR